MVIAIKEPGLAYAAVPKAGCSSVKEMLAEIDPEFTQPAPSENNHATFHTAYPTRRWRGDHFQRHENAFRFTVVRDPIKRLMSVYTNRVVDMKDLHKSRKLRNRGVLPLDPDPDTFFANLKRYARLSSVIKHHILPTWMFAGPDLSAYDKVYRTDQMNDLAQDLSAKAGKSVVPRRSNSSRSSLKFDDLKPETQQALRPVLADEYRYLSGYFDNPLD